MGTLKQTRLNIPRKSAASPQSKNPTKPNTSILKFFQKCENKEGSLFLGNVPHTLQQDDDIYNPEAEQRYNEVESPVKKRKVNDEHIEPTSTTHVSPSTSNGSSADLKKKKVNVPFIMDSDSEEDEDADDAVHTATNLLKTPIVPVVQEQGDLTASIPVKNESLPFLRRDSSLEEHTHMPEESFDMDELDLDAFEGEELRERRFMQEQARLEAEEAGELSLYQEQFEEIPDDEAATQACPICNGSLSGVSADEATRHVNACLDGNPTPLPTTLKEASEPVPEVDSVEISKRFAKAAVPRPGQSNPFDINGTDKGATKSAFSQLMSGNAEDSAWATAAAAENASRGRPAYMRTCPFYKIMPGFSICVDAFRYGAVEGCKAYFLSHFHSDHYIGLTANWMHGPIYCSKVTGSLVRNQLRTAAKWVVELDFDKEYDVPGTEGATVTMISANHCPGSSMFLFEKAIGSGPNKKTKRILHCGDFRACAEHVRHPLLRPDVQDSISGKLKQQRIDICYLDTTYLNPRYSFPPQNDVIQASADLCASLSPDPNAKDEVWEQAHAPAGTTAVSKYFQTEQPKSEAAPKMQKKLGQRLLVICGTYSIGKERICVAIAKALGSKIYASPSKQKICKQLGDPELTSMLTSDPVEAQVHMQMLMEIRAETLQEYLNGYKPHFSRIVGFRPSGWNFRPTNGAKAPAANVAPSTIPIPQLLHGKAWRTRFTSDDFVAQRGSTKEAMCFGVPYSEHSSFRELGMFLMCLRIDKVIPTVNVGSEQSRKRMKGWIDRWMTERRKCGLVRPLIEGEDDDSKVSLWDGKPGTGGGAWW